jgi:hypothetical protein
MAAKAGRPEMSPDDAWGLHVDEVVHDRRKEPDPPDALENYYELPPPTNEHFRRNFELALKRVGRKDEDRAQWLLRFAAQNLASLSEGQRVDLTWDIVRFAIGPPTRVFKLDTAGHSIGVPIGEIHQWVGDGVRTLSNGMVLKEHGPVLVEEVPSSWRIDARLSYRLSWDGQRLLDEPLGDIRPRFAAEAYRVLIAAASRFKFCPRCRTAFIARGRQQFCQARCSQAVRTQRYRAAQNPDKASQARREAYGRSLTRQGITRIPKRRKRRRARSAGP